MIYNLFSKLKIEKNDLRFFFPLGALAGVLMEVTSFLPERVNRGLFSDLLSDHLPWTTITSILIIQFIIVLFFHTINKPVIQEYVHDLVEHAAKKIGDFCSPAFSIMFGLSLACTVCSLATFSLQYLGYSLAFGVFSLMFIAFIFMSEFLKQAINSELSETIKKLFKVAGAVIIAALIILSFINNKPINVSFSLPVGEYELLEKAALETEKDISSFAKDATVSKSIEVISDK